MSNSYNKAAATISKSSTTVNKTSATVSKATVKKAKNQDYEPITSKSKNKTPKNENISYKQAQEDLIINALAIDITEQIENRTSTPAPSSTKSNKSQVSSAQPSPTKLVHNPFTEYEEIDIVEDTNQIINYIDEPKYNMINIPTNVSISTMSLGCYLGTLFKPENIYKYMILDPNNIVSVKSSKGIRCLDEFKTKFKSTNKNSKKNFYNQNTIIIRVSEERFLNIKLFKNGSIQITGCKQLSDANIGINKLIQKLKEKLMVRTETGLSEITFVDNPDLLTMTNLKIDLINSNFGVSYLINKEDLYQLLTEQNILCRLSSTHSCVNIKFKAQSEVPDTYVSIFVFQTGNIIITGAKNPDHVRDAYNFIVSFLSKNKLKIMQKDISKILTVEDFKEILDNDDE